MNSRGFAALGAGTLRAEAAGMTHPNYVILPSMLSVVLAAQVATAEPSAGAQQAALDTSVTDAAPGSPGRTSDAPARPESAPFELALVAPVQTSDAGTAIHGLRLDLPYAINREVYGVDFGIASRTEGKLFGVQLTLVAVVDGEFRGLQRGLFVSVTRARFLGWQHGIYGYARSLGGLQTSLVNHVAGSAEGAELGLVNVLSGSSRGATLGLVNHARRATGLQLGVVNTTGELHGVQIGLVNVAPNAFVPFMPVLNMAP